MKAALRDLAFDTPFWSFGSVVLGCEGSEAVGPYFGH